MGRTKRTYNDCGAVIPGAKKYGYVKTKVTKAKLWANPFKDGADYKDFVADYLYSCIRCKPYNLTEESVRNYKHNLQVMQDNILNLYNMENGADCLRALVNEIDKEYSSFKAICTKRPKLEKVTKTAFCEWLAKKNQPKKPRVKRFTPIFNDPLRHIGAQWRGADVNILPRELMAEFGLRGVQFGNYTTEFDRLHNCNQTFDSFQELALVTGIKPSEISLGRQLAMAFGARGRRGTKAHFEPDENVINLTRDNGAGSLAHEWGHALDAFINKSFDKENNKLATERGMEYLDKNNRHFPTLNKIKAILEDHDTDYYKNSLRLERGERYYTLPCEMFARAFNAYVFDTLQELEVINDYLCSQAIIKDNENNIVYTNEPLDTERETLNALFNDLMNELQAYFKIMDQSEQTGGGSSKVANRYGI